MIFTSILSFNEDMTNASYHYSWTFKHLSAPCSSLLLSIAAAVSAEGDLSECQSFSFSIHGTIIYACGVS